MALYFLVEGGQIQEDPRTLPNGWRNISGLHRLSAAKLKALGWLPERVIGFEPFEFLTQVRNGPVRDIQADKVVSNCTVRDKTTQEIDDEKDALGSITLEEPGLIAYALGINDRSIVPGSNMTNAQLKAAIKAKR